MKPRIAVGSGRLVAASSYFPSRSQSSQLWNTLPGDTTVLLFRYIFCSRRCFLTLVMLQLLAPVQPLSSPKDLQKACPSPRSVSTWAVSGTCTVSVGGRPGSGSMILSPVSCCNVYLLSDEGIWFPRPELEVGGKGYGQAKMTTT